MGGQESRIVKPFAGFGEGRPGITTLEQPIWEYRCLAVAVPELPNTLTGGVKALPELDRILGELGKDGYTIAGTLAPVPPAPGGDFDKGESCGRPGVLILARVIGIDPVKV